LNGDARLAPTVEARQTINLGHLEKPSNASIVHGLNQHYYSLPVRYKLNMRRW